MRPQGMAGDLAPFNALATSKQGGIPASLVLLSAGSPGRESGMDKNKAAVVRL